VRQSGSLREGEPAETASFAAILQRSRALRHGICAGASTQVELELRISISLTASNHSIVIKNS
jgi:hypothetical protein